jgi:hypothetical protein
LLRIQSFLVYLQLDRVLDRIHELSSRSEAGRRDAIAYACSESWYSRLSRSILYKPWRAGKAQGSRYLSREYLHFLVVVDFIVIKSIENVPLRRVSRHAGMDVNGVIM